ncbi:hypothetical protein ACQPZA_23960 [Pseudonocardia xinjiangensis]|uniref:hypothetical protein n=1 Tax=Pseudonocardia xinjiangensis TaxID=75289 RepID=UPI003D92B03B
MFFEQAIRDNLDPGRPERVSLIFDRRERVPQPRPPRPTRRSARQGRRPHQCGQVCYDLRRLRVHGHNIRVPRSHRYQLTDSGLHHATLIKHNDTELLRPGLAQLTDSDPPAPSTLRAAARNYQHALDELTQQADFAA